MPPLQQQEGPGTFSSIERGHRTSMAKERLGLQGLRMRCSPCFLRGSAGSMTVSIRLGRTTAGPTGKAQPTGQGSFLGAHDQR